MKTIRPYTSMTVKTTDGRYRPMIVTTVTDQNHVIGRIGLKGNSASVAATRFTSTTTRGTEFRQV
jgi:hypothetical protein